MTPNSLPRSYLSLFRVRADMLDTKIKYIQNWKPTKKRQKKVNCRGGGTRLVDTSIRFYDGRPAEIGTTLYRNENMVEFCRVVCIRAKKPGRLGLRADDYDYFAWLTNIGEHEKGNEAIIYLYRGRGNAENFIKEMKNGYELHNYPCLKLNANRAYALAAAFAHNILRFLSWKKNGQKAQFAKAIRHQLISLPCQVIRTGRQVFFKFTHHVAKEVERFLITVKHQQNWLTNDFESGAAPDARNHQG